MFVFALCIYRLFGTEYCVMMPLQLHQPIGKLGTKNLLTRNKNIERKEIYCQPIHPLQSIYLNHTTFCSVHVFVWVCEELWNVDWMKNDDFQWLGIKSKRTKKETENEWGGESWKKEIEQQRSRRLAFDLFSRCACICMHISWFININVIHLKLLWFLRFPFFFLSSSCSIPFNQSFLTNNTQSHVDMAHSDSLKKSGIYSFRFYSHVSRFAVAAVANAGGAAALFNFSQFYGLFSAIASFPFSSNMSMRTTSFLCSIDILR